MQLSNWSLLTRDTGHQVRKEDLNSASEMEVERAAVVGIMIDMCQIAAPSLHVAFWPLMFSVCVLQCCRARSYQFTLIGLTLSCPWGNAISGRFYCFKPDHLLEKIFMFAYMCAGLRCDSNSVFIWCGGTFQHIGLSCITDAVLFCLKVIWVSLYKY